jgi:hypothetical protein
MAIAADVESSLRAKFEAVLLHLDERSARLVLAAGARALGHGEAAGRTEQDRWLDYTHPAYTR